MELGCEKISELLPIYVANNTTKKQNDIVVRHAATCPSCRADLAFWFTVGRATQQSTAPAMDFAEMLAKIPHRETELDRILHNVSHQTAFELVRYAFKAVGATYRLASLI